MKLLEHVMKIVERILERRIPTLVNLNKMPFGFMPEKETVDAIFIEENAGGISKEGQEVVYVFC